MKLSYKWLCEYVNLENIPLEKVIEKINLSICEVDSVDEYIPELKNVICVQIKEKDKIPDSNLNKYIAYDGKKDIQIVSGDLTLNVGEKVPVVLAGNFLFQKKIVESEIKKVKSYGMFCSEKDLNISEDNSNVMRLDDIQIGESIKTLAEFDDYIFTIDNKSITHRPDLWSHFGFARELAGQFSLDIKFNPLVINLNIEKSAQIKEKINIEKSEYAHSYYGIILKNIRITESNKKIKNRLEKCGIRSINNIVDISNYVLLETGQPTHFFDKVKLSDINIGIDKVYTKTEIKILDETIKDCNGCIVIQNNKKVVAIAGLMGGIETSVNGTTSELFLESAIFKREDIRKSIRITGLRTEASIRYEKGLNPATPISVINRIIHLLRENGCPDVIYSNVFGYGELNIDKKIHISFQFIRDKLGTDIEDSQIRKILERLGFIVEKINDLYSISIPNYRSQYDVTIKEDLVEEVGRTLGYSNIPLNPVYASIQPATLNNQRSLERDLKRLFSYHLKYNEIYNYSFISKEETNFEGIVENVLMIQNSMPVEFRYLRTSLYPGLIRNIILNQDRYENIKIYELGRIYSKNSDKNKIGNEEKELAFCEYDFDSDLSESENNLIQIREKLSYIFNYLNIYGIELNHLEKDYFHPSSGIAYLRNNIILAELGILHPNLKLKSNLKKRLYIGKIYINNLFSIYANSKTLFDFKVPSNFPQDSLDISILLDEEQKTEIYSNLVLSKKIEEIENIYVKSIYRGDKISERKKSVTYHIELINYKETFSQPKIKSITDELLKIAVEAGFKVR